MYYTNTCSVSLSRGASPNSKNQNYLHPSIINNTDPVSSMGNQESTSPLGSDPGGGSCGCATMNSEQVLKYDMSS